MCRDVRQKRRTRPVRKRKKSTGQGNEVAPRSAAFTIVSAKGLPGVPKRGDPRKKVGLVHSHARLPTERPTRVRVKAVREGDRPSKSALKARVGVIKEFLPEPPSHPEPIIYTCNES